MDGKAKHNMQCWSNAKEYLVGNCKNTEKSIANVKTIQCKEYSVSLWLFVMTRLTEEMTVITTARA